MKNMKKISCIAVLLLCLGVLFLLPSAVAAAEPYRIGVILATTGRYAAMGTGEKLGANLAAEKINADGGIKGHKIELIFEDDEGDPGKGTTAIRKVISLDKVVAIFGSSSNVVSHSISLIAEENKVPIIAPVPSTKFTVGKKFAFQNVVNKESLIEHVGQYFHGKKKWKKVGILHDATEYGLDMAGTLGDWLKEKGVGFVNAKFSPQASDVTPQWLLLRKEGVDGVFLVAGPPMAAAVAMKNRKQLGINIPILISSSLNNQKFLELCGDSAEGAIFESYFHYGKWTEGELKLINYMKEKVPDVFPTLFHALGWDAIHLFSIAMQKAGNNPLRIRDELEKIKNFKGAVGDYNLSPDDHNGLSLQALCYVVVQNGQYVLLEK